MSNIHIEGFDYIVSPGDRYYCYSSAYASYDDVITRSGSGQSLKMWHPDAKLYLTNNWVFGDYGLTELYLGFAFYSTAPGINGKLMDFVENVASRSNASLWLDENYRFILKDTDGVETKRSAPNVISSGAWNFIEIKIIPSHSSSAGDFSVRVNEVEVVSCDPGDDYHHALTNGLVKRIVFGNTTPTDQSEAQYYDDVYFNSADGSKNNTFIGSGVIRTLYPNGNGYSSDFVGSDADQVDNYLHVDDPQPNEDTDYIESNTLTDKDTFTFDNSPVADTIHGITVGFCFTKVGDDTRGCYPICRRSSTDYRGPNTFYAYSPYNYLSSVFEDDPSTAGAWTNANLDAAEFGIEVFV